MTDNMEIDSPPPEPNPLKPRDRVVSRLAELGVPKDYLDKLFPGLVDFVKDNWSWIPELVAAILPTDEEVSEVPRDAKKWFKKTSPKMKNRFRESMVWLQWLMFLDEPSNALQNLSKMSSGRGVCGAVWGHNDIAYKCRTCENDPTCAICVPCFQNGDHKDHDYSVIHTGGGCCDCGDETAWKREGFCSKHKGAEQMQPLPEEFERSVGPVLDALLGCWKNKLVSAETICQENGVVICKKIANELTFVVVEMLLEFCKYSESLLAFVSNRVISLRGLLEILVRAERFLSDVVVKNLHELLLKLLGEPIFKYEFAKAFLSYYPFVVREVIKENTDEALKKYPLLSTFSVQIFTVPTLTPRHVKEMNLLDMLLGCLGDIFVHCAGEDGRLQFTKWENLFDTTMRLLEDIRFVLSHGSVLKYVTHDHRTILRTWMKLLYFLQGVGPVKRETGLHVEEETENIRLWFYLDRSISNIHNLIVDEAFSTGEETAIHKKDMDEIDVVRQAKIGRLSQESSVHSVPGGAFVPAVKVTEAASHSMYHRVIPSSVTWLTHECLRAIENYLEADNASAARSIFSNGNFVALKKTLSNFRKGKYIFGLSSSSEAQSRQYSSHAQSGFHTSVVKDCKTVVPCEIDSAGSSDSLMEGGSSAELDALRILSLSDWPDIIYDVSSQEVSVQIPLHRLLSLLLQKALSRCHSESAALNVTNSPLSAINDDFFGFILGGCHPYAFSAFVMEHPLRNRVFCAQVHAEMWRKNGDAPIIFCEWYHSVLWSEQGLELDLFLLQCCAALAPPDLYVSRILERFGLSDYLSLKPEQFNEYEAVLMQEMLMLIIQIIQERRFSGLTPIENLKRELVHMLAVGDATHSQLVKSLPRELSKIDQLQEILDTVAAYSGPSVFHQGTYSLKWTYWKDLDLYHPRWNSRDLQVVEERYMRYCSTSAWTTQLPRWTNIYSPLKGVARIATCKMVLQIIRAVLFYAVFTDKLIETRAPDGVLLHALHLLSLALDISFQYKDGDISSYAEESASVLSFALEEIQGGLDYGAGYESLLSLLVLLMRIHKRKNVDNLMEAGICNLSSLIESLLKRFAEIDSRCMTKLQQLAPEVVIHLSKSTGGSEANSSRSASDGEKRRAKARERQAAIMAKMKAEQSKFLSNIDFVADDDSKSGVEESSSDDAQDLEESMRAVCSLCHDPNSKNPVSFLVLLQKSRLLSFIDRGPPSWEQVQLSDKEELFIIPNKMTGQSGTNEAANYPRPGEANAIIEFVKAQFPSLRSPRVSSASHDGNDRTTNTFEILEQDMYFSIQKEMHDNLLVSNSGLENEKHTAAEGGLAGRGPTESVLLGKYVAALSRDITEHASSSDGAHNDKPEAELSSQSSSYDGFGPADCDGVHLSSCGHAVHQGCLDRYLLSLKERYIRRIVFEGGTIVDPDQGEFLCPVCRCLANSVLPSPPGHFVKVWKPPMISTIGSLHAEMPLAAGSDSLFLQHALSLLTSAKNVVEKGDILEAIALQGNEKLRPNLDSLSCMLFRLYFPNRQDKLSGSARINHSMIMWDTLKYSLASLEIAARCGKTKITPTYSLDSLYSELKSSSGFSLSLLLKTVQSMRSKNPLHVLQRFRGIQLIAESLCSEVSNVNASSTHGRGGNMSCILAHFGKEVSYPDIQFWNRAADPVLAHDAFSSLMWTLFCLPSSFLLCEESFLSLVHIYYAVSVAQAIIMFLGKRQWEIRELGVYDSLMTDISKVLGESGWIQQFFVSNYFDPSSDIIDIIRRSSFPYLRRCALLWKLLSTSVSTPFGDSDTLSRSSHAVIDMIDSMDEGQVELNEVQELEKLFRIPPLFLVLKDRLLRSLVTKWLHHFCKEHEVHNPLTVLHITPAVPFKLMNLPHIYQDLLQRYIKRRCVDCNSVLDEPALCLLCGGLCSPNWKHCCRENRCQTHAMACGAGTGVFLLIKRTTILLQRSARQAPWPSPYLDAFGEEDIEIHRGKPLYLNEERYATLAYLVASHGLDRSSKVLGQTTMGSFLLV